MFFFFNDTATTEIYTLSLHDALPISAAMPPATSLPWCPRRTQLCWIAQAWPWSRRSEEHTSELQSQSNLVCRLLLEKKKKKQTALYYTPETLFAHTHSVGLPVPSQPI